MGTVSAEMCEGEYESLQAVHDVVPSSTPRPVSWGEMTGQQHDTYFILEDFCDMTDEVSRSILCARRH